MNVCVSHVEEECSVCRLRLASESHGCKWNSYNLRAIHSNSTTYEGIASKSW